MSTPVDWYTRMVMRQNEWAEEDILWNGKRSVWGLKGITTEGYFITKSAIIVATGVFKQSIVTIDCYRVMDADIHRTFFDSLMHLSSITVNSSDNSKPVLHLKSIPKASAVQALILKLRDDAKLKMGMGFAEVFHPLGGELHG